MRAPTRRLTRRGVSLAIQARKQPGVFYDICRPQRHVTCCRQCFWARRASGRRTPADSQPPLPPKARHDRGGCSCWRRQSSGHFTVPSETRAGRVATTTTTTTTSQVKLWMAADLHLPRLCSRRRGPAGRSCDNHPTGVLAITVIQRLLRATLVDTATGPVWRRQALRNLALWKRDGGGPTQI